MSRERDGDVAPQSAPEQVAPRTSGHEPITTSMFHASPVLDFAPVMMSLSDLETGLFTDVNEEALRLSGFTREEVIGSSAVALGWITSETRDRIYQSLREHGRVNGIELTAYPKHGDPVECLFFGDLVTIDGRQRLLAITQNLTDYKRSQRALAESEHRYRQLIDRAPIAIAVARGDRVEYANQAFADMHGLQSAAELIGEPIGQHIAPEERERFLDRALRRQRGEPVDEQYETVGLRADGSRFPLQASVTVVRFEDGVRVVGFFRDVSNQRDAENRLRSSEARFRAVVENSHDGIVFTDADGIILYRSASFGAITGFTAADRVGKPGWDAIHPDDIPEQRRIWAQLLAVPDGSIQSEYRLLHADGSWRYVETTMRNLLQNPDVGAIVITSRDITDRRRTETERRVLQARLAQSQKIEAVGRLAGGVAHDFNNMLSVILCSTEFALHALEKGHPARADLLEVQKAAERSATLTAQLLAFARQQPAMPEVLDLNEAVEQTLSMLGRLIGEHIRVQWSPCQGLWTIKADRSQIDQILTNLAVNARDAISGAGTLSVATANVIVSDTDAAARGVAPGRFVSIVVQDTGEGMSRDTLAHIFEPFFTTRHREGGTGLGLSTVYGIVKQNGGYVDVDSEPGRGTTFSVFLPEWAGSADERTPVEPVGTRARGGETILVVEDEAPLLKLTERVLDGLGYRVLSASNAAEAFELVEMHEGSIDLLLTDVILPEMNGRELSRRLQAMQPALKCLFTSGYTADLIGTHGVLDPDVEFLQKPWTADQLGMRVRRVLDTR